ncbi:hypothetical protein TELCIR_21848, partial [Teladorsagia circumcincta]
NPVPNTKDIGRFVAPITSDALYDPGQLFIHKTFAYKGVVVCAFKCRFQEKKSSTREVTENIEVTVTTFYLGSSMSAGQLRHMWRYVI